MGHPGLDPRALGLKEGSHQYLRSSEVEKVLNKRKTRSPMSAWFNSVRSVRGIKRGISEERFRAVSPPDITGIARRTKADVTARQSKLEGQLAKTNEEGILSRNNAITIPESDLLNKNSSVVTELISIPTLLLTVADATKLLATSRTKLYELLNSRAIDSVYIGRSRRIRLVDLEAFVNGLETKP